MLSLTREDRKTSSSFAENLLISWYPLEAVRKARQAA